MFHAFNALVQFGLNYLGFYSYSLQALQLLSIAGELQDDFKLG